MKNISFETAYKGLNQKQKEAVDAIEGPVIVIAGPGTGKTTVLTLRIANILRKTDTPANGILALTFTESAVHSMRQKLVELIGSQAYRVNLFTFHGFAQEIINRYPEYFPRIIGGTIASDSERLTILEEALKSGNYELIKPFGKPFLYVRKALSVIADLKRDTVAPKDFKLIILEEKKALARAPRVHEKGRLAGELTKEHLDAVRNNEKNTELAELYDAYEKGLRKRGMYDFEDMLVELVLALKKHKDLLRSLQEEYLYLLADEHQDANNAQNAVLELLSDYRDTRNLFIVGDEKQAIYRFQGASLENFLYFKKKFPDARIVFLNENYRSTQTILDASHGLIGKTVSDANMRPRLKASSREKRGESPLRLVSFETEEDELGGIAEDIAKAVKNGISSRDIAVFVRTNAEVAPMGRILDEYGVEHTLFADDDALTDPDIEKLLLVARAVVSPENDTLTGEMLLIDFLGLNPMDAVRINRSASERRCSPIWLLSERRKRPELIDAVSADKLARAFRELMKSAHNLDAMDSFLMIVRGTLFHEHLLKMPDALSKLDKLARLYDEIKIFLVSHKKGRLKDFISAIETLKSHDIPLSFPRASIGARGVSVMTAHKAKGLEWRNVYLLHVADRVWGNRRGVGGFRLPLPLGNAGESERENDERRLFYVGLTRAKESVTLSYASKDANGKDRLPSRFAEELPSALLIREEGKRKKQREHLERAIVSDKRSRKDAWDRNYLRELFFDQGMNSTALNNYLDCPWKYFFRNLVRIPDIPGKHLHFGTAVHSALKALFDAHRDKRKFSEKDFVSAFEAALLRLPLSQSDHEETLKKGRNILPKYYSARAPKWNANTFSEYSISGVFLPLPKNRKLLLRGRIDKIELLDGSKVNVVDYKTGPNKTRNEILVKTKNSNGDIKRQLDFYRLLLELHNNGKYEAVSADVDFVEPDRRGKIRAPEHFEMSNEDARDVRETIARAAEEIISFDFWDERCDNDDCEFCRLRELLG